MPNARVALKNALLFVVNQESTNPNVNVTAQTLHVKNKERYIILNCNLVVLNKEHLYRLKLSRGGSRIPRRMGRQPSEWGANI